MGSKPPGAQAPGPQPDDKMVGPKGSIQNVENEGSIDVLFVPKAIATAVTGALGGAKKLATKGTTKAEVEGHEIIKEQVDNQKKKFAKGLFLGLAVGPLLGIAAIGVAILVFRKPIGRAMVNASRNVKVGV